MKVERLDHINIRIPKDKVEEAVEFYRDILGFEAKKLDKYRDKERTSFAFQPSQNSMIHVRPKENFKKPKKKNFDHFCLITNDSITELKEKWGSKVEIERESNPWGPGGRAPAVYIKDPFGYTIEIKENPEK
ncbi:MAG: VOC family protein [Candidatus Nanohalobium sp.]